jgi:NADH-quinone oxidoreductase subunit F
MLKLSSIDELKELRKVLFDTSDESKPRIVFCAGTACQASGSNDIIRVSKRHIIEKGLVGKMSLRITGCHGFCEMGPFILTEPQHAFYAQVKLDDVPRIIDALLSNEYVEDLLYQDRETGQRYRNRDDIPFFKNQQRSILGMNQKIDPIRIYDYIAQKGYIALEEVLSKQNAEWVVQYVKRSGLRGRGGGGFPTGLKWELLAKQPNMQGKFLVCNADEGDPGAYMDRSVLEGNPHSIIEGMIIGAYGTGATEGIVYVRNEYPVAVKHLNIALQQARQLGFLGDNILGTGFSFDIKLVKGAGAFVCGEETALIRSIEGKMGEPRQRPPFPVQKGIEGKPTAINNVETWANIPLIFRLGAKKFAKIGTEGNSGTKIFSLVGKIKNTGLVEVPMGMTIKEIVYDIGGGSAGKARIKSVQTGGPSGGCIPSDMFDLPVDYESLADAGSIMGSGGMIVMDENTCMVDVAKYFMNFLKDESCGKCFTCRKGTQRMYEILDDISKGNGTLEHLDLLKELAEAVKDTTMCGLGQTASNPVLSTLRYFQNEYRRHIIDKKCDAFVCKDLVGTPCQTGCPLGTEVWRYVALIEKGKYEEAYKVIREVNPFPSVCARVCGRKCETRCNLAVSGGEAIAIRAMKRFITDRIDPSVYKPARTIPRSKDLYRIAVVGAGPAGLSAAHSLSLLGYKVTLIDAADEPGGMLISCIPAYRLPQDVTRKEIELLLDENITLRSGTAEELAKGHVGIVGGGNSAVDATRVAIRQKKVKSVMLLYRRTSQEMPAYAEEVEAALEEGIRLETLVSPTSIRYIRAAEAEGVKVETFVQPVKIDARDGHLADIQCVRNKLGDVDSSGRRRPVPIPGTEFTIALDTLIVAIGERPDSDCLASMGLELDKGGRLRVDAKTLCTNRKGVFAGGDLVTGPNTVVNAIAAGRKAARVIDRYIHGKELVEPPTVKLPSVLIEPAVVSDEELEDAERVEPATLNTRSRKTTFAEVEKQLSVEQASREARRCLRCDLEFTQRSENEEAECAAVEEKSA